MTDKRAKGSSEYNDPERLSAATATSGASRLREAHSVMLGRQELPRTLGFVSGESALPQVSAAFSARQVRGGGEQGSSAGMHRVIMAQAVRHGSGSAPLNSPQAGSGESRLTTVVGRPTRVAPAGKSAAIALTSGQSKLRQLSPVHAVPAERRSRTEPR